VALAPGCSSSSAGIISGRSRIMALFSGISSTPGFVGYEACSFDAGNEVIGIFPFDGSWLGLGFFNVAVMLEFPVDETGMEDTATTIFLLSLSIENSPFATGFPEPSMAAGTSAAEAYLRLFLRERNMTSATKARAMIAPTMIPAIAPPDRFFEGEADVFNMDEEEESVGETPIVMAEGAGVEIVEAINAVSVVPTLTSEEGVVLEIGISVVLAATFVADEEPSEAKAMSC
jgi:hypothetical protein